jgi:hypothetical protein
MKVIHSRPDKARAIPKGPQARIAFQTENASDLSGLVVMVDLRRLAAPTDRANSILFLNHLVEFRFRNSVTLPKVILTRVTMQTLD